MQVQFERMLNAPRRPILFALFKQIIRHQTSRGGIQPARWYISRRRMHELEIELMEYEEATGDRHPSAAIDRPNFLVCGVPVVAR
jgi:hypothetical protein